MDGLSHALLHVSDLHLGAEQPEAVEALVRFAHAARPDLLILGGNLTWAGTLLQMSAARALAERLPDVPTLVLPGPRDRTRAAGLQRWLRPYDAFERCFGPVQEPCFDVGPFHVSACATMGRWADAAGLQPRRIEAVARQIAEAPEGAWRIVVTHHPLAVARPQDEAARPARHAQALERWSAAGVQVLLAGHLGTPGAWRVRDDEGDRPTAMAGVWMVQAGCATSTRRPEGQPPAVTLMRHVPTPTLARRSAEIWAFDPALGEFQRVARHRLPG